MLDEADVMLDKQGMKTQSLRLKGCMPGKGNGCQILLFSATYNEEVEKFAEEFVPEPKCSIRLQRKELSLDKIAQFFIEADNERQRFNILSDLYCYLTIGQSIIFVERKDTASNLTKQMEGAGHAVSLLHGDLKPSERDKIIDDFRSGKTKVLITTNVLARGIDIQQVSLVINYDIPLIAGQVGQPDYSTYLHRIGRSGRFGRSGIAINFVHDAQSKRHLQAIEAYFSREIKRFPMEEIDKLDAMLREIL